MKAVSRPIILGLIVIALSMGVILAYSRSAASAEGPWEKIGLSGFQIYDIAVSPFSQSNSTVFVLAADPSHLQFKGAYRSADAGKTWQMLQINLPGNWGLSHLAISPGFRSDRTVFVTGAYSVSDQVRYVVLKSDDSGNLWVQTSEINSRIASIAVDPQIPGVVYLATWGGALKSQDGGSNWQKLFAGFVDDVAVDPFDSNIVYAIANYGDFLRSMDGGNAWTRVKVSGISIGEIRVNAYTPGSLYLSVPYGRGGAPPYLSISKDRGNTWERGIQDYIRYVTAAPGDVLYGQLLESLARSRDNGRTWDVVSPPGIRVTSLALASVAPVTLLVGTTDGIWKYVEPAPDVQRTQIKVRAAVDDNGNGQVDAGEIEVGGVAVEGFTPTGQSLGTIVTRTGEGNAANFAGLQFGEGISYTLRVVGLPAGLQVAPGLMNVTVPLKTGEPKTVFILLRRAGQPPPSGMLDWPLPNGHFFTQGNGSGGAGGTGFRRHQRRRRSLLGHLAAVRVGKCRLSHLPPLCLEGLRHPGLTEGSLPVAARQRRLLHQRLRRVARRRPGCVAVGASGYASPRDVLRRRQDLGADRPRPAGPARRQPGHQGALLRRARPAVAVRLADPHGSRTSATSW